jgi:fumarate hydratase class II
MHIAALTELDDRLVPKVQALQERARRQGKAAGRHRQDRQHPPRGRVPLTVGQEWSGYAAQLGACIDKLRHARKGLLELILGGTAVGTGLNAPAGFSTDVAAELAKLTGHRISRLPTSSPRWDPSTRWFGRTRRYAVLRSRS